MTPDTLTYPTIKNDADLRQAYEDLEGMIPLELVQAIKAEIRRYCREGYTGEEDKA